MKPRWKKGDYVAVEGLALRGFDPVSYFTAGRACKGSEQFEIDWSGVKWRFQSKQNRDLFVAEPGKYAPRFGGRCAFAVSFSANPKAPNAPAGSPRWWAIIDGKLYVNQNPIAHLIFKLFRRAPTSEEVWEKLSVDNSSESNKTT